MGLLKSIQKSRRKTKAEVAAAKKRAVQEAKEAAKLEYKRDKLVDNAEKRLLKEERKGLKNKRKHEQKLAKNELAKLQQGQFNAKTVNRWVGGLRVAIPVLLPLAYRGLVAWRERDINKRAHQVGVSSDEMAQYSGHGSELKARIEGVRKNLDSSSSLSAGFKRDANDRLKELHTAVNNAEYMNPDQRRRAHQAIERDVEALTLEIQAKINA
ncbi:DUF6474 family protein [Corynebacterium sp. S7]